MNNTFLPPLLRMRRLVLPPVFALATLAFNPCRATPPADDTPFERLNYLVSQIEETAQNRMEISECFVTISRFVTKLHRDKEDDERVLKQIDAELDNLSETYRKTEATKAWPIRFEGLEYSKDMFRGWARVKMESRRACETRIRNDTARIERGNNALVRLKHDLVQLDVEEEALKRTARDFTQDSRPKMVAVRRVDVRKILGDAGFFDEKSALDRSLDVPPSSSISDSDDELTKRFPN